MQEIRNLKYVFGRHLCETNETNSILEIRLTLYCPIFEEIKSPFLNVAESLNLCVVTLFILMSHSVFFAVQIQEQKFYDAHCKIVH